MYKNLREVVNQYAGHPWFMENYSNIIFELNHLELHFLDDYLFNLYMDEVSIDENPNNSNIAYLIGITSKEPTARIKTVGGGFPDVDCDFEQSRRDDVFTYLADKYGEGFAHIGTFGFAKAKNIFKDVCRIQDVDFKDSNEWTKLFPDNSESIKVALEESKDLKKKYDAEPDFKEIVDYASKMEGCIKSVGGHPCGVILADTPITDYVALFESKGMHIAQVDGSTTETIGLVKYDILGLKTLDVINLSFNLVRQRHPDFEYTYPYDIPVDNTNTYDLLCTSNLLGCFQIEGDAISAFTTKCKPRTIDDISAIISLYRPGPMGIPGCLESYIARSNGLEAHQFSLPQFNYIFKDSKGLCIYQEQIMRLTEDMCGFNTIESMAFIKTIAKKDREKLLKLKDNFVDGAVRNGQNKDIVTKLFDDLEEFARYGFNKSHAISYSLLTYYTAYFKANYPSEFFAACITYESDATQKSLYIEDARKNGVNVLPPDLNQSTGGFNIAADGSILFGFNGIKGLGDKVIAKIESLRPFNSFGDFLIKAKLNGITKAHIENLIHSGAMDSFGYKRSCMVRSFEKYGSDIIANSKKPPEPDLIKQHLLMQDEYFVDDDYPEFTLLSILEQENKLLGIYVSGNPFEIIKSLTTEHYTDSETFVNKVEDNGYSAFVLCQLKAVKQHKTKTGNAMAFIDAMDYKGNTFNCVMFTGYNQFKDVLLDDKFVLLYLVGKNGSRGITLNVQSVIDLTAALENSSYTKESNDIKILNLNFSEAPGTVQIRSLQNKISALLSEDVTEFKLNLNIDINNYIYHIKTFYLHNLSIDTIREINKIPNVYLTKHINGSSRI